MVYIFRKTGSVPIQELNYKVFSDLNHTTLVVFSIDMTGSLKNDFVVRLVHGKLFSKFMRLLPKLYLSVPRRRPIQWAFFPVRFMRSRSCSLPSSWGRCVWSNLKNHWRKKIKKKAKNIHLRKCKQTWIFVVITTEVVRNNVIFAITEFFLQTIVYCLKVRPTQI